MRFFDFIKMDLSIIVLIIVFVILTLQLVLFMMIKKAGSRVLQYEIINRLNALTQVRQPVQQTPTYYAIDNDNVNQFVNEEQQQVQQADTNKLIEQFVPGGSQAMRPGSQSVEPRPEPQLQSHEQERLMLQQQQQSNDKKPVFYTNE